MARPVWTTGLPPGASPHPTAALWAVALLLTLALQGVFGQAGQAPPTPDPPAEGTAGEPAADTMDTFDTPLATRSWRRVKGDWEVAEGALCETSGGYWTLALREGRLYDHDLSVRVKFAEVTRDYPLAGYVSLVARAQDATHYYAVVLRHSGALEVAEYSGTPSTRRWNWQRIAAADPAPPALTLGRWYVVEMAARGKAISAKVYPEGEEAPEEWQVTGDFSKGDVSDHSGAAAYRRGWVGFGTSYAVASFDDLRITLVRTPLALADWLRPALTSAEAVTRALKGTDLGREAAAAGQEIAALVERLDAPAEIPDAEWAELQEQAIGLLERLKAVRKQALLQRGGLEKVSPYAGIGGLNPYKGNLNCHTMHSDGGKYADEAAAAYREAGYAFVCFTDYNAYGDQDGGAIHPRYQRDTQVHDWNGDGEFYERHLYGSGVEAYVRDYADGAFPWVGRRWDLNEDGSFVVLNGVTVTGGAHDVICVEHPPGAIDAPVPSYKFMGRTLEAGGLLILAHPSEFNYAAPLVYDDENLGRVQALEVYNGFHARNHGARANEDGHAGFATRLWDQCLDAGWRVWGVAGDGTRSYDPDGVDPPFNGHIVAWAAELTKPAILEALRAGRFYASSGVIVERIEATGSTVRVQSSNATRIRVIADGDRIMASVQGGELAYELDGSERWLRIELENNSQPFSERTFHQMAWLQPFVVGSLFE